MPVRSPPSKRFVGIAPGCAPLPQASRWVSARVSLALDRGLGKNAGCKNSQLTSLRKSRKLRRYTYFRDVELDATPGCFSATVNLRNAGLCKLLRSNLRSFETTGEIGLGRWPKSSGTPQMNGASLSKSREDHWGTNVARCPATTISPMAPPFGFRNTVASSMRLRRSPTRASAAGRP